MCQVVNLTMTYMIGGMSHRDVGIWSIRLHFLWWNMFQIMTNNAQEISLRGWQWTKLMYDCLMIEMPELKAKDNVNVLVSHLETTFFTRHTSSPETVVSVPASLSITNEIQRDKDTRLLWKGRGFRFDERMSQQSTICTHAHIFRLSHKTRKICRK